MAKKRNIALFAAGGLLALLVLAAASLSMRGKTAKEMRKTATGDVSLRGDGDERKPDRPQGEARFRQ
jgi:hypothetical protein